MMTGALLLALFLSLGLLTTLPVQAQESPPATYGDLVPLPDNCSDITPGDQPPVCCAFGYVLVDGEPALGAEVQISSGSGTLTITTTLSSDPDFPDAFYAASLSDTLAVEAGDTVTFTVTYDGFTVTRVHEAQAGSQQVDLVINTFEGGHFQQTDFLSDTVVLADGSTENVRVDDIGGAQYIPILALDRNRNKLYAAWTNDYGGYHIAFSESSDGGQSWAETQLLHHSPINSQMLTSFLVGSDGTLYMAWAEGQGFNLDSFDIYFSHSADGGQSWSSPVIVNDYEPDSQGGASLAIDGNHHLYIAWVDFRDEVPDIYFAKSTDGGQNWSNSIQVNDAIQFSTQELFNTPSLVVDNSGSNVYIAWTDKRNENSDIYFANSSNSGETFEPNMRLNDNQQNSQRTPRLAIGDDGTLVAVWADERSGSSRIYFAKSPDHGLTWNETTINDHAFITEQKDPNVVIDGHGQIYAAWHEPQPCRNNPNLVCSELILARSPDEGERWYPIVHPSDQEQTVAIPAFTNLAVPALVVDSNEQLIIAWQDNRDNYSNFYTARWPDLTHRYTQGTYISKIYDAGEVVGWQAFDWAATLPAESAITFQVRTANTVDNWSDWQAFSASPADLSALPHGQYLEWRAHLSSAISTTTPSLEAVDLTVHSPAVTPDIQTSDSVLHFNAGGGGGGENPATQLLEVMNGGTGTFNWTATTDVAWLTLSATSGSAPSTIEVAADSSLLTPGTYFGEITLTAPGVPNSPHTVHVRLTVVPQGLSTWTLMFYLAADNDLAFALKNKPLALQAAAQHSNLNILVLLDGMGSDDTRLYHVLPDELRTLSPDDLPWLADEMDMGDPETLRDFVSWGLDDYPADFTYLNIANHGKGIQGIAWDSQADPDTFISVSELSGALKAATNTADDDPDNDRRLDLLHYDACLMGMVEGAYDVSGAANYLVASQNLGWSLFAFTDYAHAAAQASAPLDLASEIAQIYHDSLTADSDSYPHTIAALDLLQVENVNQQLNDFITLLDTSLITHTVAISEARLETQKFDSRDYFVIDNRDEYLDLYHLAQNIQQRLPEPAIQSAAQALMESISQTVILEHHLSDEAYGSYWELEEAHGLSIYFPSAPGSEGSLYEQYVQEDLFTFSQHSEYDEFLASLLSGMMPDDSDDDDAPPVGEYSPYVIHKTAPASAEAGTSITYTLSITNSSPLTATTLLITDTLPPGATYLSGGTLEGNIVSWLVSTLAPSDTISLQFAVSASQTITNSDYGVMVDEGFYAGTQAVVTEIAASPSPNAPVLALSPESVTTGIGETFELEIEVRTGEQEINAASAYLNFDESYLEVVSITPGEALPVIIQNEFDNANGELDFAAGTLSTDYPSATFRLATVTFRTLALTDEHGTPVVFNSTLPRSSDITFGGLSIISDMLDSTVFVEKKVILALEPATMTINMGDTFELPIVVDAGTQPVDGASAYLNFDPMFLEVVAISPGSELPSIITNHFDNTTGELAFAAGTFSNDYPSATFRLATVTFRATNATTNTVVSFNTSVPQNSDATFNGISVLSHTIDSTITILNASLVGSVTLQGRPNPPHERWRVPLHISLTVVGESEPSYQFELLTDENGQFTLLDIVPGSYEVRVKKNTTLQATDAVTLTATTNHFDFGLLREGDANNDNYVTLLDFSILASTFAKCEAGAAYDARADFNGDDCVTLPDFSLLSMNFGQGGDHSPTGRAATQDVLTGNASLIIDQPIIQATTGQSYRVAVRLEADSPVDGAAAYINFDPSLLKVNAIRAGDTFALELQNEFDNQTGIINFAAGSLVPLPPQTSLPELGNPPLLGLGEKLEVRAGFDLMVIELEALADGESPLTFQFDTPRTTEVTASGQSILTDYVDGSPSTPTAVQVRQLTTRQPVRAAWLALIVMGLLVIGVGRWWIE